MRQLLPLSADSYHMTDDRLPITDYRLRIAAITWLTAVLRTRALFANSFHADEALFAGWARHIAVWRDPLLQTVPVDKPPLLFYLQALFFPLQGPVEWAARLPNFIASILLVPLVAMWVWRWYEDEKTAVLAALLVALSPLHIQFSATAFTDPLLTTLVVAAVLVNKKQKTKNKEQVTKNDRQLTVNNQQLTINNQFFSGFLFGLAVAAKHQAWLFLPLLVGTAVLCRWRWPDWRRWLIGFLPVWGLVPGWELARTGTFALWSRQINNFGGLRVIWSWELWPRWQSWWALMQTVFGLRITAVFLLLISTWLFIAAVHQKYETKLTTDDADDSSKSVKSCGRLRTGSVKSVVPSSFDWLLVCFVMGYMLLHWFLAVPVWDRYLLPLVPVLAVSAARSVVGLGRWGDGEMGRWGDGGVWVLMAVMMVGGWWGRNGRFPVGGQMNADQGAATVAEWLDDAPYGTVLYDHWYSWQWGYHLFDKRVFVHWFPYPDALAEDLQAFGRDGAPRYLVLPVTDTAKPVIRAVESAGFGLQPVPLSTDSGMILYRVLPAN